MTHSASWFLLMAAGVLLPAASTLGAAELPPLRVAPSVDLARYAGKWYEIARLPNWFQRACAADITATYTLRPDGKVQVLNTCRKGDGKLKSAKGTARTVGGSEPNTKLKVTFFWPFSGDYWIVDLDPDYQWVLVGEPKRNYVWILARTATMDGRVYESILKKAAAEGFDITRLIATRHNP